MFKHLAHAIDVATVLGWPVMALGKKRDEDDQNFIHRGIATRSFERRFALADHIQVRDADLKDGLLSVTLVREIPEAMKPRKIDIGGSSDRPAIGGDDQPAASRTIEAEAQAA